MVARTQSEAPQAHIFAGAYGHLPVWPADHCCIAHDLEFWPYAQAPGGIPPEASDVEAAQEATHEGTPQAPGAAGAVRLPYSLGVAQITPGSSREATPAASGGSGVISTTSVDTERREGEHALPPLPAGRFRCMQHCHGLDLGCCGAC